MNILIVFIIIMILITTRIYFGKKKIIVDLGKYREILVICCSLFLISALLKYTDNTIESARTSLYICVNVIIPSLFPFLVFMEILNSTNATKIIGIVLEPVMRPLFNLPGSGSVAVVLGLVSGFPSGAIITARMRNLEVLSKIEAERLLAFTNNAGPLFLVGAIGVGMLNCKFAGYLLLITQIIASITVGIIFRFYGGNKENCAKKNIIIVRTSKRKQIFDLLKKNDINIGEAIGGALKKSINVLALVSGFIILFSVVINLINNMGIVETFYSISRNYLGELAINKDVSKALIYGMLEMTTGINIISGINYLSLESKLLIISAICGFGGICVHMQIKSVVLSSDIELKPFVIGKILHGILASIYMFFGIGILKYLDKFEEISCAYNELKGSGDNFFIRGESSLSTAGLVNAIIIIFTVIIILNSIKHYLISGKKK